MPQADPSEKKQDGVQRNTTLLNYSRCAYLYPLLKTPSQAPSLKLTTSSFFLACTFRPYQAVPFAFPSCAYSFKYRVSFSAAATGTAL